MVQLLLAGGAHVNKARAKMDGSTPLVEAAKAGHVEVIRCLLKHGATAKKTRSGGSPLVAAAFNGHTAVVELLAASGHRIEADRLSGRCIAASVASTQGHDGLAQWLGTVHNWPVKDIALNFTRFRRDMFCS